MSEGSEGYTPSSNFRSSPEQTRLTDYPSIAEVLGVSVPAEPLAPAASSLVRWVRRRGERHPAERPLEDFDRGDTPLPRAPLPDAAQPFDTMLPDRKGARP